MIQAWRRLANRIDALSIRERAMLFGGAVLVLAFIMNFALLRPQFARQKELTEKIKQEQTQFATLQGQIQELAKLGKVNPSDVERERLEGLRKRVAEMRTSLSTTQQTLIPAERMPLLLEGMLQRNPKLRLRTLKTTPAVALMEPEKEEAAPPKAPKPETKADPKAAKEPKAKKVVVPPAAPKRPALDTIYRHEVDLEIEGNYLDLLDYLAALEAMPSKVYWGTAQMSVSEYPTAVLKLTLYSLSLDKQWLGV